MSKQSAVLSFATTIMILLSAPALWAQPAFSKAFSPATIGPGSSSTLTFTIDNGGGVGLVSSLAFADTLPAGVVISDPSIVSSTCDGTISAPAGGSTITFSGGTVAAASSCTVRVDVTSSTVGIHANTSGDLTSTAGNSGPANADLTVSAGSPGFSKSFSPSVVGYSERSTLTFTIDNSANGSLVQGLTFSDSLPTGMVVADPSDMTNSCNGTLTASEGSGTISLVAGFVLANAVCTISVDVETTAIGEVVNSSGNLTGFGFTSGHANAAITVNADDLILVKEFVDDPAPPGGTTTLQFTILNRSRTDAASGLTFTDDLEATLTGLVATGLPASDVCGVGSTLSGTSSLTLTGGTIAPEASCTFDVTLQVPAAATPGSYPNTTSSLTGDLGGVPVVIAPASDPLFIQPAPALTKTFIDDPVIAGGTVTAEFTITNTSPSASATGIAFDDNLTAFAPGTTVSAPALPAAGFCAGSGSATLVSPSSGEFALRVTNVDLPAGASCTFQFTFQLAGGLSNGTYTNTTSPISGTVDGTVYTGAPASDTADVVAAPQLTKSFTDDPVDPGETATLEFTLALAAETPADATDVSFTDDLNAALAGLTAVGLPAGGFCGAGSTVTGTSILTVTGVTVSPGVPCTFSVTVQVPAGATPGTYVNTTSTVSATVGGLAVTGAAASANLDINGLTLSKSFTDDPSVAGGTVNLRFVISNAHPTDSATGITFTDDLDAAMSGLTSTAGVVADPCGAGSQLSGTNILMLTGGSLAPGTSCTIDVPLQLPAGASPGEYVNVTSNVTANAGALTGSPASDRLVVEAPLTGSKTFIDDPVRPGESTTLRFTLENTSSSATVDSITFTDDLNNVIAGLVATGLPQTDVCGVGSTLSGTDVLTLTGGQLTAGNSCTFDVTLTVPLTAGTGVFPNETSDVTASVSGTPFSIGTLSDDLVVTQAVSITKTFTNDPVERGGTATLEFTLENLNTTFVATDISFTDDLDAAMTGMVATGLPQNDVCGLGSTLSGTSLLTLTGGSLPASGSCTFAVTVQLPADAPLGSSLNTTSDVSATIDSRPEIGPADSDSILVVGAPVLTKTFAGPAAAGETLAVEFTLSLDADAPTDATAISFSDDLDAVLTGLVATGLPQSNVCGTGSTLSGTGTITLADGVLADGGTCTFSVTLQVPSDAATGTYPNTTSAVTAMMSGVAVTEAPASDDLQIVVGPTVIKTFIDDPVTAGGTATLELTISLAASAPGEATAISFTDDLDATLSGLVATGLPANDFCGTGSQITGTGALSFTGGSLVPGDSCTFQVTLDVPAGAAPGVYTNTTSDVTATMSGSPVSATGGSDDLIVAAPAVLTKSFIDDPAIPGGTVELQFTVTNPNPTESITDIAFTDDLDAALAGLVATGLPVSDVCGTGSSLTGTDVISLSGGSLPGGGSCTFSVSLDMPPGVAPGPPVTNTTSPIDGMIAGTNYPGEAATDDLLIDYLQFSKEFSGETPPGGTVRLRFTIVNPDPTSSVSGIGFTDDLDAVLPGLVAIGLPRNDVCGFASTLTGTSVITLTNGSLGPGETCEFIVDLQVPADAVAGDYVNITSAITSGLFGAGAAAEANLVINPAAIGVAMIPTLSTWMLFLMAAILAGVALIKMS